MKEAALRWLPVPPPRPPKQREEPSVMPSVALCVSSLRSSKGPAKAADAQGARVARHIITSYLVDYIDTYMYVHRPFFFSLPRRIFFEWQ